MREFASADLSSVRGLVSINLLEEHYREKVVNEYIPVEDDLFDFKIKNICTVQQLEIFYRTIILDLYRRENSINYTFRENIQKRYFIVPLRLTAPTQEQCNQNGERVVISYEVDTKLLQKTERLFLNGYKHEQINIIEWLRGKGLLGSNSVDA